MNFNNLLQNRQALIGIGAAALIIVVLIIVIAVSGGKSSTEQAKVSPKIKIPVELLETSDSGKALEVESLLAQQRIPVRELVKGSKIQIWLYPDDNITEQNKDDAIISIVRSGLMDKNVGLEIFDKGDFTSSREDKKIRLSRAINGELARLIKRLPNIKDATVFISMPKDTIFTSMKEPTTATVQLVIDPLADKLDRNIIKSVTNLIMGSIPDIQSDNIAITDTNGNVYSSVEDASANMLDMQQDKDSYMKQKVNAQLDRLIGKGNYVVTVSTYLREVPQQTSKISYSPASSSIGSKQRFVENLGDNSRDISKMSNAVSSYLPGGLPSPESSANRNYSRAAEEYSYRVGQMETTEVKRPGILEEISIAVTVNQGSMPTGMTVNQLKEMIAKTASPKARAENVEIAFADNINPYLASERPVQRPEPESSGNPWWTVAALLAGGLIVGLVFIAGRSKDAAVKQQREIDQLAERTVQQEKALQEANQKALQLQNIQQQMYQNINTPKQQQISMQPAVPDLRNTIQDIRDNIEDGIDEKEFVSTLKSWIESSD